MVIVQLGSIHKEGADGHGEDRKRHMVRIWLMAKRDRDRQKEEENDCVVDMIQPETTKGCLFAQRRNN